jgi:hypothetical protein
LLLEFGAVALELVANGHLSFLPQTEDGLFLVREQPPSARAL